MSSKRKLNPRRRRALKRKCFRSILGEDELYLIMTYYIDLMILSHRKLNDSKISGNLHRHTVFRTLFALSSSPRMFEWTRDLFSKYLYQTHLWRVFPGQCYISKLPEVSKWSYFQVTSTKQNRVCLEMSWGQVISICGLVICDESGKYKLRSLNEFDAKQGRIGCDAYFGCVPILNLSKKNYASKFAKGLGCRLDATDG